jgi:hypothetical protein
LLLLASFFAVVTGLGIASVSIGDGRQTPAIPKSEQPRVIADAKDDIKPKSEAKEQNLAGTVLGADGKPIEANLSVFWIEGKSQLLGKTNADGTFRVTVPNKLQDLGGWLVATAAGHGMDFYRFGPEYVVPQSMKLAGELTLRLPKERQFRGRILDLQGKPVSGASLVVKSLGVNNGDAAADGNLSKWGARFYMDQLFGMDGGKQVGHEIWFADQRGENSELRSPYTASTDKDGRFVIAGIGAEQVIHVAFRGAGKSDRAIVALNREGFDPAPINTAFHQNVIISRHASDSLLCGPDRDIVVELEKIIRGTVTDQDGKPRVGVRVVLSRANNRDWNMAFNWAITDKDGKYAIRGARKHEEYMVECPPDPQAGLLPCQGFADDSAGYEPITIDLKCAKGIVVTGTVKNKTTGEPVAAALDFRALVNNPFAKKYPPFVYGAPIAANQILTDKVGRFRVVTVAGPVLLMANPIKNQKEYRRAIADPAFPDFFHLQGQGELLEGNLIFYGMDTMLEDVASITLCRNHESDFQSAVITSKGFALVEEYEHGKTIGRQGNAGIVDCCFYRTSDGPRTE